MRAAAGRTLPCPGFRGGTKLEGASEDETRNTPEGKPWMVTQAGFEPATPRFGGCALLSNSGHLQTTPTAQDREEPQIPASSLRQEANLLSARSGLA